MANNIFITINGVSMTEGEYKAYKRQRAAKVKTTIETTPSYGKNVVTARQYVGLGVEDIMKSLKALDSLLAYSRNGYRQWGNEHTMVMNLREISSPYVKATVAVRKLMDTAEKLERYARRNSKQVPSLLEEMGWHLADTREALEVLVNGIKKSEVLYYLQNSKCINENSKRLGLLALTVKSEKAIDKMRMATVELKLLADSLL